MDVALLGPAVSDQKEVTRILFEGFAPSTIEFFYRMVMSHTY